MEALEGSGRLAGRAEHGRGLPGQGALSVVTQALTANSAAASCAFPTFPSGMLPEVALTPGVFSSWLEEPAWGKPSRSIPSRSIPPPPQVTLKRGWGPPQQGAKHGRGSGLVGSMLG